jgi:hypothetical protein
MTPCTAHDWRIPITIVACWFVTWLVITLAQFLEDTAFRRFAHVQQRVTEP